jgi:hypothetical protein
VVSGHEAHNSTIEALAERRLGLAGHAWFETFSVLTRLPAPARREPEEVATILRHNFPESRFLTEKASSDLAGMLSRLGVGGGAVYDALVGWAAASHELPLRSRDRRAADLYRSLGANVEILR